MDKNDFLKMSFEPNTIKHLGVKMYLTIPPALAELIANSYDACATNVLIKIYDTDEKKIIVEDNGMGMTFEEINNYYLRIGRNRREEEQEISCNRIPTGKKGLGKLALFGIGDSINIKTIKNGDFVSFNLEWNDILNCRGTDYKPIFKRRKANVYESNGTIITLTKLKRKSGFSIEEYAASLSKYFNFLDDKNFKVYMSLNDQNIIQNDNKLKYENISPEFYWDFSEILLLNPKDYSEKDSIKGKIITSEKPLKPGLRGISLFANGRMVNLPEFFGVSESSHFYSYTIGWLDIDFVDNWDEDVISTNRQSIDWDNERTIPLKEYLSSCLTALERDWREKRKETKRTNLQEKTNIKVDDWYSKLPFDVQEKVETIVNFFDENPEIAKEDQQRAVEKIHELIPEYPYYHWRHLHSALQKTVFDYYKNKDFYSAVFEGTKKYINELKKKSGESITDRNLIENVFSIKNPKLSVTKKYKKPDGLSFEEKTIENISEGHRMLAIAMWQAFRSPIAHEEICDLRDSGLFTENDCLDALSLLSHLYRRLENSEC